MLADELIINHETIRKILVKDLSFEKLCAKMIPKNLSEEQKHVQMYISQDSLRQVEINSTLLDHVWQWELVFPMWSQNKVAKPTVAFG